MFDELRRLNPWHHADLDRIKDHNYDYPYSKGHGYPAYFYKRREEVARDSYAVYSKENESENAERDAYNTFSDDRRFYELGVRIAKGETISDADLEPVSSEINKRFKDRVYGGGPLLGFADCSYNLQAIGMLFKYGADPYMVYDPDDADQKSYVRAICDIDDDGYRVDACRLYVKYGFDPNFIVDKRSGWTLLYYMVFWKVELAWVALMEAGGNPWTRIQTAGTEMSIAADAALGWYLPFADYMIASPECFAGAETKWIYELLDNLTGYQARDDLITKNIQRQARAILDITGIKPTKALLDYINYRPAPPKPEGYGGSPKFDRNIKR